MSAVPDVLKAGSDCEKGRGLADLALEAVVELRARPARLPQRGRHRGRRWLRWWLRGLRPRDAAEAQDAPEEKKERP